VDFLLKLGDEGHEPLCEIAAALEALASAKGLSLEDYFENQLPLKLEGATRSEGSGMVWENGLFVYRTGRLLPVRVVDDAIRQVREEKGAPHPGRAFLKLFFDSSVLVPVLRERLSRAVEALLGTYGPAASQNPQSGA